jgi:acrylyl-CoA reductase (NADPH)
VTLAGVESVRCPIETRQVAWQRLARQLPAGLLDEMAEEVTLADVPALAEKILAGQTRGRVVVAVRP